jgi:glycosyltransferase involved in cell wall biosynthesis
MLPYAGYNQGFLEAQPILPSESTSLQASPYGLKTEPAAGLRPLRILMLAPEPFFEPRGTPFSEYHRIKALTELGHHVDLVTYPFGADVSMPNLRIVRTARPPFATRVGIGPSVTKVVLDAFLSVTAWRQARREAYDLVHSHEEAGVLGVWIARRLGVPHLYDMHSSLPQQLTNFRFAKSRLLRWMFEKVEDTSVFGSEIVVTICQDLQDHVTAMGAGERSVLIENVMGGDVEEPPSISAADVRRTWGIDADAPLVLYTGTFEAYQGLDMLLDAAGLLGRSHPDVRFLVVGGRPEQVALARDHAARVGAQAVFTGHQPAREIPAFIDAADILASPRIAGTNTPLKIYSYLRAGKPIVATDLLTHTQVLDRETSLLVPPQAEAFAAALSRLIGDPALGDRLSRAARDRARTRYAREVYLARTKQVCERMAAAIQRTRVAAAPQA